MTRFVPQTTGDGSPTFFSPDFNELFHSHYGARQEAIAKFVEPTAIVQTAATGQVSILDICYGLGYNTAAALEAIWIAHPDCRVTAVGLELDPQVPQAAIPLLATCFPSVQSGLSALATTGQFVDDRLDARLLLGDARQTIHTLIVEGFQADAIFLDPFSPPHCPHLWTVEFLHQVSRCLAPTGKLATYSCAAAVRSALLLAGLQIGSTPPVGRRAPGTIAAWNGDTLPPLAPHEQEHLLTRAAIPYRDFSLQDTAEVIVSRRQAEQVASELEPASRWRQRWLHQAWASVSK
ncbi:MAG: MnmC family methyltransferase [Cyanobacteria bacterium]|nr:MnmC family methyltransferase [Cyanobacteriota bacterium]